MTSGPRTDARSNDAWMLSAAVAVATVALVLRAPGTEPFVAVAAAHMLLIGLTIVLARRVGRAEAIGRWVVVVVLLAAAGASWPVVRAAGIDESAWQERAAASVEHAADVATERLESLRERAEARARRALDDPGVPELVEPMAWGDTELEVAVSVWRGDSLVTWNGPVPGPERVGPTDRPLVVDYGFRRYLVVQAFSDDGRRAACDVALGVSDDLFPRLGLELSPGRRIAPEYGVPIRLWPSRAAAEPVAADATLRGVPADDPWSWIELSPPRPSDVRRRALDAEGRRVAVALLLALIPLVALAWNRWPGRRVTAAATLRIGAAVVVAGGIRVLLERGRVLDLAFAPLDGSLSLLFLPTYFATSAGGGILRSTADFVLTGIWVASAVVVFVPAWRLLFVGERGRIARTVAWIGLTVGCLLQMAWIEAMQQLVVKNANPLLIGLDSPFFTAPFLALHVGMLLLVLPTAVALVLGWERWLRPGAASAIALVGAATLVMVAGIAHAGSPVTGVGGAALPLLAPVVRRALASPAFARRVLAGMMILVWFAAVQSVGLERVYNDEKEQVALQEAEQRLQPLDNWRRFLLEDLIGEIADDRVLLRLLGDATIDRSNLAFEIWARTLLPSQNFGCRVELRADDGRLVSEFDIGLPYEPTPLRAWSGNVPLRERPVEVETIELVTEQGPFLVYRGLVDLEYLIPEGDASRLIVDLPYAAAEGAIPLEQNVPVGLRLLGMPPRQALSPRQTFDEAVSIGHPVDGRVARSSSPVLVGLRLDDLPAPGAWTRMRLDGRSMHVGRVEGDGRQLVVAFEEPTAVDRVLDTSRLAALYLLVAAVGLLVLGVSRVPRARTGERWPRALGVIGFEEKLLGSMILIVLLPVLLLGVIQERRGASAALSENLREVSARLDTALQLTASNLDELAAALIRGEYVQELMATGETRAARALGPFAAAQVMVFDPSRSLLLDETLSDRDPAEAEAFLSLVQGGEVMLEVDPFGWFVGRAYPVLGPEGRTYTVYVRRALDDEDLSRIARTIDAELTVYDGAWAVVSSEAYMYKAGLRSPILSDAARPVLMGESRRVVQAERFGGLAVARGYGVMAGPGEPRRGVLSARLFARATEDARELRRGQMFVFGLSSLVLVLAVMAGLALSGRIVGPIRALVLATDRIARGQFDLRVRESGRDEIGQLERSFNRMTDKLDQSRAQLAARRSFLETILGSLGAGVLVLDADAAVVESNQAARDLLVDEVDAFVGRIRATGPPTAPTDTEILLTRAEGPRTLRTVVSPARLESGEPGWLVVFDDVTELLASRRLALYAQMARQVAHEVKNPLTPIQLSAQMVRQAVTDGHPRVQEIVRDNTDTIEGQVQRLRTIASEFSLLGRERLDDLEEVTVGPLLREIGGLYPAMESSEAVAIDTDTEATVLASREALVKVLTNLVENARQAMEGRGTVRLRSRIDGRRVRISVLDEGPGIDPEVQSRLFEPYFSTKSTGTGLGLVICRNLMEKMGGTITLRNRDDRTGAVAELALERVDPSASGGNENVPFA